MVDSRLCVPGSACRWLLAVLLSVVSAAVAKSGLRPIFHPPFLNNTYPTADDILTLLSDEPPPSNFPSCRPAGHAYPADVPIGRSS